MLAFDWRHLADNKHALADGRAEPVPDSDTTLSAMLLPWRSSSATISCLCNEIPLERGATVLEFSITAVLGSPRSKIPPVRGATSSTFSIVDAGVFRRRLYFAEGVICGCSIEEKDGSSSSRNSSVVSTAGQGVFKRTVLPRSPEKNPNTGDFSVSPGELPDIRKIGLAIEPTSKKAKIMNMPILERTSTNKDSMTVL